jgi:hypothetical protein
LCSLLQEQIGIFLAGLIGFNLVASVLPNSATFKQQPRQQGEAVGPLQDPTITLLDGPTRFFGVTNWGFTPQNELFAGRLAALGITAAIVGELITGLGPVGQLSAGETDIWWGWYCGRGQCRRERGGGSVSVQTHAAQPEM